MPRLDAAWLKRKRRWLLLPAALLALPLALVALGIEPRNRAETDANHPDPALRPRFYKLAPREVHLQVLSLVPRLSTYGRSWRVVGQELDGSGESIVVRCEVPVVVFTDDLEVRILAAPGGAQVLVRSASRVGKGDMGENERHVRQILRALDERCAAAAGRRNPS